MGPVRGKSCALVLALVFAALGLCASSAVADSTDPLLTDTTASASTLSLSPSIQGDQADYAPGSPVTLTGSGWSPGETVHVTVDDSDFQSWSWASAPDPVADFSGSFTVSLTLPNQFVANYSVTATGDSGALATTTFTDAQLLVKPGPAGDGVTFTVNWTAYIDSSCTTQTSPAHTATLAITGDGGNNLSGYGSASYVKITAPGAATTPAGWVFKDWGSDGTTNSICVPAPTSSQSFSHTANYKPGAVAPAFTFDLSSLPAKTYGDSSFSVNTTAYVSSNSPGAIAFALGSGSVGCTVSSAGQVTITGAATGSNRCVITASQAAATGFTAAVPITQSFNIAKATVHVDAGSASKTYGDSDPSASGTLRASDFKNGENSSTAGISGAASCAIGAHSENAGSYTGVVTCAPDTLSAANYTFVSGNAAALTIGQATVHVDAGPASKTYGENDPSTSGTLRLADFKLGDTPGTSGITGQEHCSIADHSQDAGTYTGAITCDGGTLSAANYVFIGGDAADLTIGQATVHVDANPASKTYGEGDPSATAALRATDFKFSDSASDVSGAAKCTIGAHPENAGTYTGAVTCAPDTLSAANYTFIAGNAADLTISQATVRVDANPASKTYGDGDPTVSGTLRLADFKSGDTPGTSGITGQEHCSIADHSQDAGTYTGAITCDGGTLSAPNYTFAAGDKADLTINQATVHVDSNPASKTYGEADPSATATLRAADFKFSDDAGNSGITGQADCTIAAHAQDAGSYADVVSCAAGSLSAANYTFVAGPKAALTIGQATVRVDANAASKTYGDPDPSATATLRGSDFKYTDDATNSGISGQAHCTIANHSQNAGTYIDAVTCTPNTLASNNYAFTAGNKADLTINQAVVHMDANPASKTYGDPDPSATATLRLADFKSGDTPGTSGISGQEHCTIANHSQNAGSYTGAITCDGGTLSAANYVFAAGDAADLTISQATVHVDANPASKTYGENDPAASGALRAADFKYADNASSVGLTGQANCTIANHSQNVGTYTGVITCDGGTLSSTNYTFLAGNPADLTIGQATVRVDANPASKTYDDPDPSATATLRGSDFRYTDNATNSGISGQASCTIGGHSQNAGTYTAAISCAPNTLSAANYKFVAGSKADLTINQATVHVDANAASKTYGDNDPTVSGTLRLADFVSGETPGTVTISGQASCTIASHSKDAGTYTGVVSCDGGSLSSTNYKFIAGAKADLTISQATVRVDANPASKTYGDPDPSATATLRTGDFKYTDNATDSGISGQASCSIANHSQNVGTYTGVITCDGGTLSSTNYTFVAGSEADLTISQATLTLTADDKAITYGDASPAFTYKMTGFKNGDTSAILTGAASCSVSGVTGSPPGPSGSYTITCTQGTLSAGANYKFTFNPGTLNISVKQATLGFTGNLFWSTGSPTAMSASVTLQATLTPASGGAPDLTKAPPPVFLIYASSNTAMTTPDKTCPASSVSSAGVATCTLTLGLDNWTVVVQEPSNKFFVAPNSDPVVLTVYQPATDKFVTGGGWVTDPSSTVSATNKHGNFGLTVRYKTGTTPSGQAVFVFRGSDGYDYVVKSNSWQGGGLSFPTATAASFSGKASVTAIDPKTGLAVSGVGGGNYTYRVDVTDNGQTGDTYAISIYTPTGTLYHQAGTTSGQLALGGGNIVVHTTTK